MGQKIGDDAPLPVALSGSGGVQACFLTLDQEVLDGDDAQVADTAESFPDEVPCKCAVIGVLGVDKAAGEIAVVITALLDPCAGRGVVVGACVDNRVLHVIVRQIVAGLAGVKGKLEHLHARIAGFCQKRFCRGGDVAEVLCDDRDITEFFLYSIEEIAAGSLDNFAVLGGLVAVGNLIVLCKSVEVVESDHIIELKVAGKALDPPVIAVLFEFFPVIDGVAPELTGRGEGIRRASRHDGGNEILVETEDIRVRPGRRTVHGHIEGDVADDLDALLRRIGVEFFPLAVKLELEEAVEIDIVGEFLRRKGQGSLLAQALAFVPVCPGFSFIFFLQGHIQGIVKKPVVLSLQVFLILRVIFAVAF